MAKQIKAWITVNHIHIPIFEGESKADAVKRLKEGVKKGKNARPISKKEYDKKEKAYDKAYKALGTHTERLSKAEDAIKAGDTSDKAKNERMNAERTLKEAGQRLVKREEEHKKNLNRPIYTSIKVNNWKNKDNYKATKKEEKVDSITPTHIEPSKTLGQSLYSGSKTGISQELNKLEDGTKVHFRVNGIPRTYTKNGKSFVDENGNSRKRTDVADLLHRSWKNGRDRTLHDFYENNLKITGPSKKENIPGISEWAKNQKAIHDKNEKIREEMKKNSQLSTDNYQLKEVKYTPIVRSGKGTAMGKERKGYELYDKDGNRVERNATGNIISGYRYNTLKEARQAMEDLENKKKQSWQDKDAQIKDKQIANAEAQKAERNNFNVNEPTQDGYVENHRRALKQYQDWQKESEQKLNDFVNSSEYRRGMWGDEESRKQTELKKKELEDAIEKNKKGAWESAVKLQKAGALPRYSQDSESREYGPGRIMEDTVTNDPRYKKVLETLPPKFKKHLLPDMVRSMMYAEEQGKNSFKSMVYDFYGGDRLYYTEPTAHYKNKDGTGYDNFGEFLRDYKKVFKDLGYKVTASENKDTHRRGYRTARGGWQSSSHSSARLLTLEKIEQKTKKKS